MECLQQHLACLLQRVIGKRRCSSNTALSWRRFSSNAVHSQNPSSGLYICIEWRVFSSYREKEKERTTGLNGTHSHQLESADDLGCLFFWQHTIRVLSGPNKNKTISLWRAISPWRPALLSAASLVLMETIALLWHRRLNIKTFFFFAWRVVR